ncbi:spore cortex biosynthesis protein YabQ [Candidatus Formimonas warabiya]|uniref:Spore cortex biosynthesis protein YabQ n=1 Tax=Formimonas warabiya TaxID=1761012 RepID=A0A3G1KXQ8_FORW1|nr:spore cortex biosynthesis protein YabQ [Candidatus Formimonas warabiya]
MEFLALQVVNFLLSIAIGVFIGLLFDVYRGLWKRLSPPRITRPLWDITWWVMVTGFVFVVLLWCNWGEVRFYLFLGQIIGLVFYLKKMSRTFLRFFLKFLFWTENFLKTCFRIGLIPFKILKRIIFLPFACVSILLFHIMGFLKKFLILLKRLTWALPKKMVKRWRKFFWKK